MFSPVSLRIQPSWILGIAFTLIFGASFILISKLELELWLYLLLGITGLACFIYTIRHYALLGNQHSVHELRWSEGKLSVRMKHGDVMTADILASTFVSPLMTFLMVKPDSSARSCCIVLTRDNVSCPQQYRRLRVLLRFRAGRMPAVAN